jgi:hypothetical protein
MKRFRIVNVLLLALLLLAGWRTYEVWRRPAPAVMASSDEMAPLEPLPPPARNPQIAQLVTVIAEKDLFDPSRQAAGNEGAPAPEQTPAPPPTLKLAGVIVLDGEKEAVFADANQGNKQMRMRVGEEISGYRVQRIDEENVSLVNSAGEEVNLTLLLEGGKGAAQSFGPGGRPTPRPAPVRGTARTTGQRVPPPQPHEVNPQAFGPQGLYPEQAQADERERQREEARERAQRARERLKRLRAEAARK